MIFRRIMLLVVVAAFFGCDSKPTPEPEKPVVSKKTKDSRKGMQVTSED
jgi:hypothetical protein